MALTSDEEELRQVAIKTLPRWYFDQARADEYVAAVAKIFGPVRANTAELLQTLTLISLAPGATVTEPDWLGQHARDRGTSRQDGETTTRLRERLRNIADMITAPALLAAANAILDDAGIADPAVLVELPRDEAYASGYTSITGTGGTFTDPTGTAMRFTPTAKFPAPPYQAARPGLVWKLTIAGAADAGNDGTFATTAVFGDAAEYVNAGGVAGADAGVDWTLEKYDVEGNLRDGWTRAFAGRGYRVGSSLPAIVLILPYPTTEAIRREVVEMLRLKKAGGVLALVERREIP